MKIHRTLSSTDPTKNQVIAKNFFGKTIGKVFYSSNMHPGITDLKEIRPGYLITVNGKWVGSASDFYHASDTLLSELGILKNSFV
jgi:hypothetical protein